MSIKEKGKLSDEGEDWFHRLDKDFELIKFEYQNLDKKKKIILESRKVFKEEKRKEENQKGPIKLTKRNKTFIKEKKEEYNYNFKKLNIQNYKSIFNKKRNYDIFFNENNILNSILGKMDKRNLMLKKDQQKTRYNTTNNSRIFNYSKEIGKTSYNINNNNFAPLITNSERNTNQYKVNFKDHNYNKNNCLNSVKNNKNLIRNLSLEENNKQPRIKLLKEKTNFNINFYNLLTKINKEENMSLIRSKKIFENVNNINSYYDKKRILRETINKRNDYIMLGDKKIIQTYCFTKNKNFLRGCKNLKDIDMKVKDENHYLNSLRRKIMTIYKKNRMDEFDRNKTLFNGN